jgi:hypothetical protein
MGRTTTLIERIRNRLNGAPSPIEQPPGETGEQIEQPHGQSSEPVFICDAPRQQRVVLLSERKLTAAHREQLRVDYERWASGPPHGMLVIEPGFTIYVVGGANEWPDAEHCAA